MLSREPVAAGMAPKATRPEMNFLRFIFASLLASAESPALPAVNLSPDSGFFTNGMRLALWQEDGVSRVTDRNSRLSPAGWLALAVLAAFFFASLWYAVKVWTSMAGVHMSGWGWLFLVLGVVVTIALG